jgi:predicted secreted protein
MTSAAFWAYGSKMQYGNGAGPEVFADIAEVLDINPPAMERDDIEVTNQQSTGGWREFIPGWRDGGEVEFNCNWLPTNSTQDEATGILESFNDNVLHNWKIVLPDGTSTISFAGFLTGFEPDLPLEEQGQLSITIKVSGAVTVATP